MHTIEVRLQIRDRYRHMSLKKVKNIADKTFIYDVCIYQYKVIQNNNVDGDFRRTDLLQDVNLLVAISTTTNAHSLGLHNKLPELITIA